MGTINLKISLKNLSAYFKSGVKTILYIILFAALLMDIFVLYSSVSHVIASRKIPEDLSIAKKGVKLDFKAYDKAVERINAGKKYSPKEPLFQNPFGAR